MVLGPIVNRRALSFCNTVSPKDEVEKSANPTPKPDPQHYHEKPCFGLLQSCLTPDEPERAVLFLTRDESERRTRHVGDCESA